MYFNSNYFSPIPLMGGLSNSDVIFAGSDLEFDFIVNPSFQIADHHDHLNQCMSPSSRSEEQEQKEEDHIDLMQVQVKGKEEEDHIDLTQEQVKEEEEVREKSFDRLISSLNLKLPSSPSTSTSSSCARELKVEEGEDNNEDGFKTPTSVDHHPLKCPPPPRKPKSCPLMKRKANRGRVLLDLSGEIDSIFSPEFLAELGGKIKKVRRENINPN